MRTHDVLSTLLVFRQSFHFTPHHPLCSLLSLNMPTPGPRNAAHSVLFCKEILLEILGCLSPGWFSWDHSVPDIYLPNIEKDLKPRRLLQKTLASSELWKVLDHHIFILKLLPCTVGEDGLFNEVIDLEPDIDEQAWSRFRWYARLTTHPWPHCHGCHRCAHSRPGSRSRVHFTLPLTVLSAILPTSGLRASPLRSISLESAVRTPDGNTEPLPIAEFQHHLALIRAALPDALEALQLWFVYSTRAEPPEPLSTLFAPFLSLGHLKSFDLAFSRGYVPHVSDDDLRALVAAWPHLEVLRVWVWEMRTPTFSSARPPTVMGLVELAKGCPRLRQVTLPALDVSVLPQASALPREGHKGVWFLDMSVLVKDEEVAAEDVARVLDKVFPCVEEYSRVAAGARAQSWGKVQGTMREIQAAWRCVGRE
ncbi:hypothetical protein V8D89_001089 [Ganoderma adspersum]